jgi:drug/metabolite transporter (DMT)-like permease
MSNSSSQTAPSQSAYPAQKAVTRTSIILAFASVYFFWGSTYTAIRVGAAEMPALLLAGTRFLIAGAILLAWCRWRGMRVAAPPKAMLLLGVTGLLLLGGGNVGLVYAERTVPSGLACLAQAVVPLYVALIEMVLPGGEALPARGWMGVVLGITGLGALLWPTLSAGFAGDSVRLWAVASLLAGALSWSVGSIWSRRVHFEVNSMVASGWQMLIAGVFSTGLGTMLGQWPQFHLSVKSGCALAYLITGGSLLGYTCFIYLIDHVPVAKVSSYTYVNPVVAVLLGIFLLNERPGKTEFVGMAAIMLAVYLLTTAQIKGKPQPPEELEQLPAE